jgi:hypothetical protein
MRGDAVMGLVAVATWTFLIPLLIWKAIRTARDQRRKNLKPPMTNGYPDSRLSE